MNFSMIDPVFPQIPQILESQFMIDVLQNAFFAKGASTIQVEDCQMDEKRYKPGKKFQVTYRVSLNDSKTNSRYEQIVTAKLTPANDVAPRIEYIRSNQTQTDIPSICYLPEISMLLWIFPYDRKLKHLADLLNTQALKLGLAKYLVNLGFSYQAKLVSVAPKVMHYLPEESCMIRYTLSVTDPSSPTSLQEAVIYGKHYSGMDGAKTYSIMCQLASPQTYFARPLSYDEDTRTLFQVCVPGLPCDSDVTAWFSNQPLIIQTAKCIAAFHRCELHDVDSFGMDDITSQLAEASQLSSMMESSLKDQTDLCILTIQNNHQTIDWKNSQTTPLHLDLKLGNFLALDNTISLIDLDCVRLGDHLIDIGSFVANLYLQGVRAGIAIENIDRAVSDFCQAYFSDIPWVIDERKLNWYIAAALIYEVVRRSIRQQAQQRLQYLSIFLELSERYSKTCQKGIRA